MTNIKILFVAVVSLLILTSGCRNKNALMKAAHDAQFTKLLPILKSEPVFMQNGYKPQGKAECYIPLLLSINSNGEVDDCNPRHQKDSAWARYLDTYLSNLKFTVAVYDEISIGCQLGVMVEFRPRNKTINLITPVDSNYQVLDYDLLKWTLHENLVSLPAIQSFPSYFCNMGPDNPDKEMKFMVFEIDITHRGEVEDYHLVSTNMSAYSRQLSSAMLYARFNSARAGKDSILSKTFLMVSFFPHNRYPTPIVDSISISTLAYHEALALRFLSDTSGIISKPIPRSLEPDSLSLSNINEAKPGRYVVQIQIDTAGSARMLRTWSANPNTRTILRHAVQAFKFYPALSISGEALPFEGQVIIDFTGPTRAGISYQWLEFLQKPLP